MLLDLHVKNLALIENAELSFGEGLNILTGETGAGKSIVIGSVNMALGGKAPKDIIREGAEYAYIELVFSVREPDKIAQLKAMDVAMSEDGLLIISKKIMTTRSVSKINDEMVTASKLKDITSLLIDIHGQHEHQSLLYKSKHLQILDAYAKARIIPIKYTIAQTYGLYQGLKEKIKTLSMDQDMRLREADFCRYEIEAIENAALQEGEEEELTNMNRRFRNSQKIMDGLSSACRILLEQEISMALKEINQVARYDEELLPIRDQLFDADAILSDINHDIASYMDKFAFDEEEFLRIEERLDVIHGLQAKYGDSIPGILSQLEEKQKRLEELENHDSILQKLNSDLEETVKVLEEQCSQLSEIRKAASQVLTKQIREGLKDLNFIDVKFEMEFGKLDQYTASGYDEAEFLISTNPGERLKPLGMVASGGELSRIMLAIKSVLADSDEIPTLIFDEIDTGISGRTAQKVSEKLSYIGGNHQVICITHLPQIAAMADSHYAIEKAAVNGKTTTTIRKLGHKEMIQELARLLGGAKITDTVYDNAREMKELAKR